MEMNPGEGLKQMTQEEAEKWRAIAVGNTKLIKRAVEAAEHVQLMYTEIEKRHEQLIKAAERYVKLAEGSRSSEDAYIEWCDEGAELENIIAKLKENK